MTASYYQKIMGTKVKQQICDFLKNNPAKKYSNLDLNKELEIPPSSLSVNLNDLKKVGLIKSERKGKFKLYWMEKSVAAPLVEAYDRLQEAYTVALMRQKHGNASKVVSGGKKRKTKA